MSFESDLEQLRAAHDALGALRIDLDTAAFVLNEIPVPRFIIAFALGRCDPWVTAAIRRTQLSMQRWKKFRAHVERLVVRLSAALGDGRA